jgi:plastocyanin
MTTTARTRSGRQKTRSGRRKLAVLLALLAFGLALAGLRGEGASARGEGASGGATAQASGAATVVINHFAFHPPTLTIAKGTKVTFSNTSKVTHTATSNGSSFDSGLIKPGTSVGIRFKQKGTFAYHCEIHPRMHGKIVVD